MKKIRKFEENFKRKRGIRKGSAAEAGYLIFKWSILLTILFFVCVLILYIIGKNM